MAKRRRANAETTLLCAIKFWSGYGSPSSPFYKNEKLAAAYRSAVRSVARKQGFTPAEVTTAERKLVKAGLVEKIPGMHPQLKLTPKGRKRSCATVKLAPWTDPQHPGSRLEGVRGWTITREPVFDEPAFVVRDEQGAARGYARSKAKAKRLRDKMIAARKMRPFGAAGTHRSTHSTKGWAKAAPKTTSQRRAVLARCGRGAFLKIGKSKTGKTKPQFPIVSKGSTNCAPDCRGLRAAKQRASQTGRTALANKATRIAKAAGCAWAKGA